MPRKKPNGGNSRKKKLRKKLHWEMDEFDAVILSDGLRLLAETPNGSNTRQFLARVWPLVISRPTYKKGLEVAFRGQHHDQRTYFEQNPFTFEPEELEAKFREIHPDATLVFPWEVLRQNAVETFRDAETAKLVERVTRLESEVSALEAAVAKLQPPHS